MLRKGTQAHHGNNRHLLPSSHIGGAVAHLLRLMLIALLSSSGSAAFALIPKVYGYRVNNAPIALTPQAACDSYGAFMQAEHANADNDTRPVVDYTVGNLGYQGCVVYYTTTAYAASVPIGTKASTKETIVTVGNVCPTNSSEVGDACKCNAGYQENAAHDACVPPPDPCAALAGTSAGPRSWQRGNGVSPAGSPETYMCGNDWAPAGQDMCVIRVVSDLSYKDNGIWYATGTGYYTGERAVACNGDGGTGTSPMPSVPKQPDNANPTPTPGAAAPSPCPAGQAPGEVNGTAICAPRGPDKPTETPATGNGTTTTENADGTTTTTTQTGTTTCSGGMCTTTTNNNTTVNNKPGDTNCPTGSTVGSTTSNGQNVTTCTTTSTSTSTSTQTGFCKDNPASKQCGNGQGGGFGGNCKAGFTANGDDAVLNAMALEQYKRNCQVLDTTGAEAQEITTEMAKTGERTKDTGLNSTVDVGPSKFDTTDALGGGSCSIDKTITVYRMTVTLPFSNACSVLLWFGNLGVACSLLLAARIVARG